MNRLELLKSDLRDCDNPKVLAKYPHLGSETLKEQIRREIRKEEARIPPTIGERGITP